jgi:hypothetical protein
MMNDTYILGINRGYNRVKGYASKGATDPFYIEFPTALTLPTTQLTEDSEFDRDILESPVHMAFGDDATLLHTSTPPNLSHHLYFNYDAQGHRTGLSIEYQAALFGAIAKVLKRQPPTAQRIEVILSLCFPVNHVLGVAADVKKYLSHPYPLQIKGKPLYQVIFSHIETAIETLPVIRSQLFQLDDGRIKQKKDLLSQNIGILDLGGFTGHYSEFRPQGMNGNRRLIDRESMEESVGNWYLLKDLRRVIQQKYFDQCSDFSDWAMMTLLQSGQLTGKQGVSLQPEIEAIFKAHLPDVLKLIRNVSGEGEQLHRLILAGGGCYGYAKLIPPAFPNIPEIAIGTGLDGECKPERLVALGLYYHSRLYFQQH